MKILGGHDYYDSAMGFGIDQKLVFMRDHRMVEWQEKGFPKDIPFHDRSIKIDAIKGKITFGRELGNVSYIGCLRQIITVVAGKIYYGLMHSTDVGILEKDARLISQTIIWSVKDLQRFVQLQKWRINKRLIESWENTFFERINDVSGMAPYFDAVDCNEKQRDWLITNKVSILVTHWKDHKWYLIINPQNLRSIAFANRLDPFTCFQELSMWIGGVLPNPGNPMVNISDKDRIYKHGFDKMSFRKYPEKG